MEVLVQWFSTHLSQFISPEGAVFIISMIPILELRGGLLAASLLKIPAMKAIPLCIVGKSDQIKKYEFLGLMLFVGIPLPGTGAWTGSLIASLLEVDIKKSSIAILCGLVMATVIMYIVSYGIVGNVVH